jgi:hypothetical protein
MKGGAAGGSQISFGGKIMYNRVNETVAKLRVQDIARESSDAYIRYEVEAEQRAQHVERSERHTLHLASNGRVRCLLCGIGHRLVGWGQYLEQHFAPIDPVNPPNLPARLHT